MITHVLNRDKLKNKTLLKTNFNHDLINIIDWIHHTVEHESMSMYIKAFWEVNNQKLINNSKIRLRGIERRKIGVIFMQFYRYR